MTPVDRMAHHLASTIDLLLNEVDKIIGTEEKDNDTCSNKVLVPQNMSPAVLNAKYAVRGAIVKKANQIKAECSTHGHNNKHPFSNVVFCNIGNPQAFCSPPITFHRQVLACIMYPPLMDDTQSCQFPKDVIIRAKRLLNSTAPSNIGAYTTSQGLVSVRESVANYLFQRDGFHLLRQICVHQ